jgi:hypothetical protein
MEIYSILKNYNSVKAMYFTIKSTCRGNDGRFQGGGIIRTQFQRII